MSIEQSGKVTAEHLRRDVYLYVRQSSLKEVVNNSESTQRQYALRGRAVALGWEDSQIRAPSPGAGGDLDHAVLRHPQLGERLHHCAVVAGQVPAVQDQPPACVPRRRGHFTSRAVHIIFVSGDRSWAAAAATSVSFSQRLSTSGMQAAAEWLRADRHVDVAGADTCRISDSVAYADGAIEKGPAGRPARARGGSVCARLGLGWR
ncbi:hypothetical protein A6P39_002805 [Streptomyces sp. FXJ1.172]|uniref:hypothetical protein n=1 Tax=Streptomyces sp. FXJ1.172 TaxID=710705 RepID=UPI0007D02641|nr:hypothetical protein [Streptomyces sp. FXJ1.172]WEO93084.1 hypothetical protein A6P39_002805 [Streptomyces sp. FXJ1.172]